MFRKSRMKIVALIMCILVAFLIGTLTVIYFTTYGNVMSDNRDMMEMYADLYIENGIPEYTDFFETTHQPKDENTWPNTRRFQVSTFYSVAFVKNSDDVEINNASPSPFTDEEIVKKADTLLENNQTFGIADNMIYLVTDTEDFTLVTIMDNTVIGETIDALMHFTVLFGGIAIGVLFVLSIILAHWIIKPLEMSYQKQKQFISDAGHELKTPVSTINANVELLEREISENRWLSNIKYENHRMADIVYQLLDLAKLENVPIKMDKFDLSRSILAGVLPFEANAFDHKIKMKYEIPENIWIIGERIQIEKLITILLDNAFSHSKAQGNIQVCLSESHSEIHFMVSNEGEPIAKEERKKIFDRFYRMDQVRNGDERHYGLGLSIAKQIVLVHKGKIYVSCKDGKVEFHVVLPKEK